MLAFDIGLKQLSVAQLRKLAFNFKKNVTECENKDDYVNVLSELMSLPEKLSALRTFLLAGRTSMALFKITADSDYAPVADFQVATAVPSIVSVGTAGEIIPELQHISWAVLDGQQTFLDEHLELQVEPSAIVIDTFFDPSANVIQVRGGFSVARKIAKRWANLATLDYETQVVPFGLSTVDQVHAFCDLIGGRVVKCEGEKLETGGFHKVTGAKHPTLDDLRGTPDYVNFLGETDGLSSHIEFTHEEKTVSISLGLQTRSIMFRTLTLEPTMQYVYQKVKEFLNV
jgi:hypothetical protein